MTNVPADEPQASADTPEGAVGAVREPANADAAGEIGEELFRRLDELGSRLQLSQEQIVGILDSKLDRSARKGSAKAAQEPSAHGLLPRAEPVADQHAMNGWFDNEAEAGQACTVVDDNRQEGRPTDSSGEWANGNGDANAPTIEASVSRGSLMGLQAREISAWFGDHLVLDRVSLEMPAGQVTALIGPSGCGKSTFLRILNRMHELVPSAALAGEVLLGGDDIYRAGRRLTDARRQIGMVFQKPNPFPAMSIYDNVIAGLKLTGQRTDRHAKDDLVEECLVKAGLWNEVRDRLRQPGGGLSGGQQQRLCIARSLAIRPRVLLMDEPCSALDPTSTRVIEETIAELVEEVTIVIVTHNMQQAARVSDQCAFFLASQGTPGVIVEHGPTTTMFSSPQDPRTSDYVNGRFG